MKNNIKLQLSTIYSSVRMLNKYSYSLLQPYMTAFNSSQLRIVCPAFLQCLHDNRSMFFITIGLLVPQSIDTVGKIVVLVGLPGFVNPVLPQELVVGLKTGLGEVVETSVAIFLDQLSTVSQDIM